VKALQFNRTGESRYSLHDVALSLASCERHSRYPTLRGDFTHPSRKDTLIGARLDIESSPDMGTTLSVALRIAPEAL
jgi:hypothetical protein